MPRRTSLLQVRRLLAWCLLFALPIYGLSAAITQWLGPVHVHVHAAATIDADPMAGWQDFRRHDHVADAGSSSARHHHMPGDASVLALGGADHDDGTDAPAANGLTLSFVASAATTSHLRALPVASAPWPRAAFARFHSADARRLDRPPSA